MKKNQKLILSLFFVGIISLIYSSCKKTNNSEISDNLSVSEIRTLAKSMGELHNNLLNKVGNQTNLNSLSKADFTEKFYSIKIPNINLHNKIPSHKLNIEGLSNTNNYIDNHFKSLSILERKYFKEICSIVKNEDYNIVTNNLDNLLNQILEDKTINGSKKLQLSGTLEVARNSSFYWRDVPVNIKNPFHVIYENSLIFPYFTCSQLVDIIAAADWYGYYSEGGYPPQQAATAAGQDAAYASGLSVLAGGGCH